MRGVSGVLTIAVLTSCTSEPILIGKLCSPDHPCPIGLFCDASGACVEELEDTAKLSLVTEGPGAGIVTSAPAGLRCDASCEVDFPTGTMVTLEAHPIAGSGFAGWRGACRGSGSCLVSMVDAQSVTAVFGVEAQYPWVVRWGGPGDDRVIGVDVDLFGGPIVAGSFSSTVLFGSESAVSAGGTDGFVAGLNSDSTVEWVATQGGIEDDVTLSVSTSIDAAILATGWYFGPASLFGEEHPGTGAADPLVARLASNGARELASDLGSTSNDISERAIFDDGGGAWVAGWVAGPLTVGGITRGHVGGADAYLIHYDASGAADVVEVFGGMGDDRAFGLDRSANGDRIALFGNFSGSITFGGPPVTSTTTHALFVAVFDSSGEHLWSKGFAAGETEAPFGAGTFDRDGNLIVGGGFQDSIHFGDRARPSAGDVDGFVAKLSPDGVLFWAETFGGPGPDAFFEVKVDDLGQVVLGGGFNETAAFGGDPLESAGGWDALLVKLDADGQHVWSRRFGGSGLDVILGVGLDVAGTVVAGGHFGGTVDFGSMLLTSAGSQDGFLLSLGR
jgi:hypothetical protein